MAIFILVAVNALCFVFQVSEKTLEKFQGMFCGIQEGEKFGEIPGDVLGNSKMRKLWRTFRVCSGEFKDVFYTCGYFFGKFMVILVESSTTLWRVL